MGPFPYAGRGWKKIAKMKIIQQLQEVLKLGCKTRTNDPVVIQTTGNALKFLHIKQLINLVQRKIKDEREIQELCRAKLS